MTKSSFTLHTSLFSLLLLCACQATPEKGIENRLEDLVSALNAKDVQAASRLYKGGVIPAVNDAGDSSAIYRLLHIPGGEDFALGPMSVAVIEDRARATVELQGKVVRGDSVVGEMALPLKLELERDPSGEWMILP
jgi:hypothetical protein